jgi:ketosteroid isomerase-like protein
MRHLTIAVAIALLWATSLTAAADDLRKSIEANNAGLIQDLLRGDAKAVAERYTADATVFPPGAKPATGTAAIEAFWMASITAGIEDIELVTGTVESAAGLAYEDGVIALTNADGATSRAHYVVVWKRVAGEWKLHRDIWN